MANLLDLLDNELIESITFAGEEYLDKLNWKVLVRSFGAGLLGDSYSPSQAEEKCLKIIGRWINSQIEKKHKDRQSKIIQQSYIDRIRKSKTLRALRSMDPKDFEYWSAGYFIDRGYRNVWVVPPGPDFGLDIQMTCPNGNKAIVQCKRYSASHLVDRPTVQQTYGVMHLVNAKKCYLITTSGFTRDALELGKHKNIELIDVVSLLKKLESLH